MTVKLTQADFVISCFGGIRPTARKLRVCPNTVQQWKKRGLITSNKHQKILDAAKKDNLPITPETLINPPSKAQLSKLLLGICQQETNKS